jgi:hypothetical protein
MALAQPAPTQPNRLIAVIIVLVAALVTASGVVAATVLVWRHLASPLACAETNSAPPLTVLTSSQVKAVSKVTRSSVVFSKDVGLQAGSLIAGADVPGLGGKGLALFVSAYGPADDAFTATTCVPGAPAKSGAHGLTAKLGSLRIAAPESAFPQDTTVRVTKATIPSGAFDVDDVSWISTRGEGWLIAADRATQPKTPVTLTVPVPDEPQEKTAGYLLVSLAADGSYAYAPTTPDPAGGTVTGEITQLPFLGVAQVAAADAVAAVVTGAGEFLDEAAPPAACSAEDRTYDVGDDTYVIGPTDGLTPCLLEENGSTVLRVVSTAPTAVTVTTEPPWESAVSGEPSPAAAIVQKLSQDDDDLAASMTVYPGAGADFTYPKGTVPTSITVTPVPGRTLTASLAAGLIAIGGPFGLDPDRVDAADPAGCLAKAADPKAWTGQAVTAEAAAAFLEAAARCFEEEAKDLGLDPMGAAVMGVIGGAAERAELGGLATRIGEAKAQDAVVRAKPKIFAEMPKEMCFASGAGGWATCITMSADGSFTGRYYDSDMGDTGPGYPNGTRSEVSFTGRFEVVGRVSDLEYTLKLADLKTQGTPGEERIIDGVKVTTARGVYGFDDADEFALYLPGRKTADLPEEFLDWVSSPQGWTSIPATLPVWGLYNIGGKEGFSNW